MDAFVLQSLLTPDKISGLKAFDGVLEALLSVHYGMMAIPLICTTLASLSTFTKVHYVGLFLDC